MMDRREIEGLAESLNTKVVEKVSGPNGITYCHLSNGMWKAKKDGEYIGSASSLEELQQEFESESFQNGCKKAQTYINQKMKTVGIQNDWRTAYLRLETQIRQLAAKREQLYREQKYQEADRVQKDIERLMKRQEDVQKKGNPPADWSKFGNF